MATSLVSGGTDDSQIGAAAGAIATRVASRITRRSFFGGLGRIALVSAVSTGAVAGLANVADALACDNCDPPCVQNGCNHSGRGCPGCTSCKSVSCEGLTGSNTCPSTTRTCGFWHCGCMGGTCGGGVRKWTDCCETGNHCNGADSCRCVEDLDGVSRKTCCGRNCYGGGQCQFIRCRKHACA
jgi:hypothetical protein